MLKDDDRITTFQMFVLIISAINAIEVLILPIDLALSVGPDGWAVLIGGHIISGIGLFFIVKLGLLFSDETFAEYTPKILGRFLGVPIVLVAVLFWILISARIVRQFGDFIELILPQTSIEVLIITMLLVVAYVIRHGIEPIARVAEILFPIFVAILGLLVLVAMFEMDFGSLMPVLHSSPKTIAWESIKSAFSLEGQEIPLMLLPFMAIPQRAYKAVFGALAFNMVLRISLFVATIGIFGVELVKTLVWPVEELTRSIMVGGNVVGRFDSVFTALWVSVAFSSIFIFLYLASLTISRVMKFREQSMMVFPLLPVVFVISLIPESMVATEIIEDYLSMIWGVFVFTVPPLLLLVSYIRGTHRKQDGERLRDR